MFNKKNIALRSLLSDRANRINQFLGRQMRVPLCALRASMPQDRADVVKVDAAVNHFRCRAMSHVMEMEVSKTKLPRCIAELTLDGNLFDCDRKSF